MTVADRLGALLGVPVLDAHGVVTADVPRERWVEAVTAARDDAQLDGRYFDHLTAVDQHPGGFDVVVRLWSVEQRHGFHLRTGCPREDPRVPSLAAVFGGAAWHERQAAELFGLVFDGHPSPGPLLLPAGFEGAPLRKDVVLASRVVKPWPGVKEPGESDADLAAAGTRRRRKAVPPGVPTGWEQQP